MAEEAKKFPKTSSHSGDLASVISDAWGQITGLGEEFREIYDNAPENLQQNDVNQQRDETASAVENLSEPDVSNTILAELTVDYTEDNGKVYRGRQSQSRACRASNASAMFRAAADAVNEWLGSHGEEGIVEEHAEEEGKWVYVIGTDISDETFDTEEDAKAALNDKLGYDMDDYNEAINEGEALASALEEIADEIDGMEWPGMFG
jgi:DNA-binding transcriptional ArsR family regulator